jgi:hypothetical protein
MPARNRTVSQLYRRALAGVLVGVGLSGLLAACSTLPIPPTYTEAELKAICERRGGWWRGELIPGHCEYQAASLSQAP